MIKNKHHTQWMESCTEKQNEKKHINRTQLKGVGFEVPDKQFCSNKQQSMCGLEMKKEVSQVHGGMVSLIPLAFYQLSVQLWKNTSSELHHYSLPIILLTAFLRQ
jgi:hypothetical protein